MSCAARYVSRVEENKYGGQNVKQSASLDLGMLIRVEGQPNLVVGSRWHVECVTSCVCFCE